MPLLGTLPLTASGSSKAGSVVMLAVPLTRKVSLIPGTKKISPTPGRARRLPIVSTRLLPSRSGIRRVWSSMTLTKPGASPFGEASQRPDGSLEAMTRKGDSAVKALEVDPELRLVIVTGAGERAFVGGADINELAALDTDSAREFITLVHRCCDGFHRLPVPVIARIDGYALGAGLELAAACDLRVASNRAVFGMPEVRVGIPSVVEAALLPQLIGYGRARRLLLTG